MKKILALLNNPRLTLVYILLISFPAILPLIHVGYFPVHDSIHVARMYEMYQGLRDLQFPVRWAPDLRYGEPLFNFYAPLPFYVGAGIHFFRISFIDVSKVLLGLSFFLPAVSMFYLSRKLFGKFGGFLSAALYVYAPYHSVDVYVRGAMSEALALTFFPLIFLYSLNLSEQKNVKNFIFLTLSMAGLFLTHNIMTVLFMPFFIAWWIFLVWGKKKFRLVKLYLLSLALALGLTSSFLLPAYFEKDLIQETQLTSGYYDFRAHFVEVGQFFSTFWGYGASVWGPQDGLSFQIGIIHWILLALTWVLNLIKRDKRFFSLIIFLFFEFLFSLFMQHNKSTPIWLAFPILSFAQFPWRFLGVSIFLLSIIGGYLGKFMVGRVKLLGLLFVLSTISYNLQFFHPQFYYSERTDLDYISPFYLTNEGFTPRDYVPIFVKKFDSNRLELPRALSGKILADKFTKTSSSGKFSVNVLKEADLEIPITYFPGWEVFVNGKRIEQENPTDLGLIHIKLTAGNYLVDLNFENTEFRLIGNLLSGLSILVLLVLAYRISKT